MLTYEVKCIRAAFPRIASREGGRYVRFSAVLRKIRKMRGEINPGLTLCMEMPYLNRIGPSPGISFSTVSSPAGSVMFGLWSDVSGIPHPAAPSRCRVAPRANKSTTEPGTGVGIRMDDCLRKRAFRIFQDVRVGNSRGRQRRMDHHHENTGVPPHDHPAIAATEEHCRRRRVE